MGVDPKDSERSQLGSVLIVDDEPANLRYLSSLLRQQGYTVFVAREAEEALHFLETTPPDLVLLDVRMPGMNGLELCTRLKSDAFTAGVPVIFISAAGGVHTKLHAFAAGAADYVVRPFEPQEVLARVGTHMALRRLQLHLEIRVAERTAELEAAREALAQGQRLLQAIIDESAAIICVKDADGRYVLANRHFHAMFGAARDVVGLTDADIFPPATAASLRAADAAVLDSGTVVQREEVLPGLDGPRVYVAVRTPLTGATATPAVCSIFTDITGRVHEEQALRALNELLESRLAKRAEELPQRPPPVD